MIQINAGRRLVAVSRPGSTPPPKPTELAEVKTVLKNAGMPSSAAAWKGSDKAWTINVKKTSLRKLTGPLEAAGWKYDKKNAHFNKGNVYIRLRGGIEDNKPVDLIFYSEA